MSVDIKRGIITSLTFTCSKSMMLDRILVAALGSPSIFRAAAVKKRKPPFVIIHRAEQRERLSPHAALGIAPPLTPVAARGAVRIEDVSLRDDPERLKISPLDSIRLLRVRENRPACEQSYQ